MSADLLRRAATRLRESALAATPGPWVVERSDEDESPLTEFTLCSQAPFEFAYQRRITSVLTPDKEWPDLDFFALVHPPVALALARVLESYVWTLENTDTPLASLFEVLNLAREVLREPEGGDRT